MNRTALIGFAALIAAGCQMDPTRVEEDFGNSVRQMVSAQILDPEVASSPAVDGPDLLDGTVGEFSIDGYRKRAEPAEDDEQELSITFR